MNSMFELRFPTFALFTYKVVRLCQVVGRHQCCLTRASNCYGHLYATTPVLTIPDTLKNVRTSFEDVPHIFPAIHPHCTVDGEFRRTALKLRQR
ncbi:hypothetical protein [Brasilonema sennae]|uniref:hypothetical protein n=1 Tax=Brasilonema sennae TaxID=1397703 RepID=UPI00155B2AB3|nr:hypothetical protein [Brasilonema sennae]